jgi:acyl carrier protein
MSDGSTMTRADFLDLLEGLLEQPGGALSGSEELEALAWDSLKGLEFLVLVDENFGGYQVSPEQLAEVRCVNDLIALLGPRVS